MLWPMNTAIEAIYEKGVLKLATPLDLPEKARVLVRVLVPTEAATPIAADSERAAWIRFSEENLTRAWDNPEDDAFNALLDP